MVVGLEREGWGRGVREGYGRDGWVVCVWEGCGRDGRVEVGVWEGQSGVHTSMYMYNTLSNMNVLLHRSILSTSVHPPPPSLHPYPTKGWVQVE